MGKPHGWMPSKKRCTRSFFRLGNSVWGSQSVSPRVVLCVLQCRRLLTAHATTPCESRDHLFLVKLHYTYTATKTGAWEDCGNKRFSGLAPSLRPPSSSSPPAPATLLAVAHRPCAPPAMCLTHERRSRTISIRVRPPRRDEAETKASQPAHSSSATRRPHERGQSRLAICLALRRRPPKGWGRRI